MGGNANYVKLALPLFIRVISLSFLRVGLCSHTVLPFAGDVAAQQASDLVDPDRAVSIAWTRVHAISDLSTHAIFGLSDDD